MTNVQETLGNTGQTPVLKCCVITNRYEPQGSTGHITVEQDRLQYEYTL